MIFAVGRIDGSTAAMRFRQWASDLDASADVEVVVGDQTEVAVVFDAERRRIGLSSGPSAGLTKPSHTL